MQRPKRITLWLLLAAAAAISVWLSYSWISLQIVKQRVLGADPALLAQLGQHVVVGYRDDDELDTLLAHHAAGGVFITARNVEGHTLAEVQRMVQDMRTRAGVPLLLMTDQEGGSVSRMSPPLDMQPALSSVFRNFLPRRQEKMVRAYARKQAQGLRALGLNMNLSPVVDLNHGIVNSADRYTRIYKRAISADPATVTRVAGWYCDELAKQGVHCTLKHFPGLGRVMDDTHLMSASLDAPPKELQKDDWRPFRQLMRRGYPVMLSHVRLSQVDGELPVSVSDKVVRGLLREQWQYDGLLITDDFSMSAIDNLPGGTGGAAVKALNAGVDLILVSYKPELYYPVMDALLKAARDGRLNRERLAASAQRIARVRDGQQ